MNKKHLAAEYISNWRRLVAVLLVTSFFLLPGCGSDHGATEPTTIPDVSIETSCPTEQTVPTETVLPTEPSTESTSEPPEAPTTEPTTEPTTAPTEKPTTPPTEAPATEPTQAPTTAPTTAPTEAPTEPTAEPTVPETELPLQIQLTPDNTQVLLIHQRAWGFARRDQSKPVEDAIYSYKLKDERLDISVPVTLSVNITNIPKGVEVVSITITFADNAALAEARTFRLTGSQRSVDIPFLMAGRKYYYQAAVLFSDGTTEVRQTSFRTASTPRLLSIDGIVNVRDIGGWQTTDGYVVRQGLLYRGSELDGAVEPEFCLTAEGLRQMREVLGIRSDLDLRYQDDDLQHISPLGADITYIYYDAPSYTGVFKPNRQNMVRRLFADLADESNYPVYLHCTYGVDRTGTFCYLLEALLGVSEEDLQRDYELSTLYYTWVASKDREDFLAELKTREGNTLQEKTETFLLECGVTPEQIAAIRDIFLEKA